MKSIVTITFLIFSALAGAQTTWFVNANAAGGQQTGTDWTNAFTDLQEALASAHPGDAIWVAGGTYYPSAGTNRTVSFELRPGVALYGGFSGLETAVAQRDYQLNETVLSGDIGTPAYDQDNAYHVVSGTGIDSTSVLDGFTITRGMASENDFPYNNGAGGGMQLLAAFDVPNTCPVIRNCRFEQNLAYVGGAIYCAEEPGWLVNPALFNCQFVSNQALGFGGALYKNGAAAAGRPFLVEDCRFERNAAYGDGGACFLTGPANTTVFRRCTFEKDSARISLGGALYYVRPENAQDESFLWLDSCVFDGNYATEGGAIFLWDQAAAQAPAVIRVDMNRCVFDGNKAVNADGGAYRFAGLSNATKLVVNQYACVFKNNLTHSYATTKIGSLGFGGALTIRIRDCRYLNNVNLSNPDLNTFAIEYAGGIKSDARIENCLFSGNGAGINILGSELARGVTQIVHCTFYDNGHFMVNKSWFNTFNGTTRYNDCHITNCIFEENAPISRMFCNNDLQNSSVYDFFIDYTMVSLSNGLIPGGSEAFGPHVIYNQDPMFADAPNGDFHPDPCSPAVNAGNNLVTDTLGLLTDLDGLPRIFRDTADMGAFEVQDTCAVIAAQEPAEQFFLQVSPNPSRGAARIVLPALAGDEDFLLDIFDLHSRNVYDHKGTLSGGAVLLQLKELPPGAYRIRIKAGRQTWAGKWIKI